MIADSRSSRATGYSTESGRPPGTTLTDAVIQGVWQTPQGRDWKSGSMPEDSQASLLERQEGSRPLSEQVLQITSSLPGPAIATDGETTSSTTRKMRLLSNVLNTYFVEALMGLPSGWTLFEPLEMASSPNRPLSRSGSSTHD